MTGFLFPFTAVTPAIILGVVSLLVLAIAIVVRHVSWRKTFVISACTALYFNVFVFVVQSFNKVAVLRAFAPTQKEPPFAIAQLVVLVLFVVLTVQAVRRFRATPAAMAAGTPV